MADGVKGRFISILTLFPHQSFSARDYVLRFRDSE